MRKHVNEKFQDGQDIEHKDQQIGQLNERMNEMSSEFANMLTETLDLMRKHVNEKFQDGQTEDANKPDYTQRLQDYSKKAYNAVTVSARTGAGAGAAGGSSEQALQN